MSNTAKFKVGQTYRNRRGNKSMECIAIVPEAGRPLVFKVTDPEPSPVKPHLVFRFEDGSVYGDSTPCKDDVMPLEPRKITFVQYAVVRVLPGGPHIISMHDELECAKQEVRLHCAAEQMRQFTSPRRHFAIVTLTGTLEVQP